MGKRFWSAMAIILLILVLGGCLGLGTLTRGESPLGRIHTGMTEDEMVRTAGIPAYIDISDSRHSIYYYKEKLLADCEKKPEGCFPVVVVGGRVVAVGSEQLGAWQKKKAATGPVEKAAGADVPVESRKAEIARLDRQVRKLPMAKTLENLTLYRRLLRLDPENGRYRRKVAFYQDRLEKEKARTDTLRKARNKALERPEGNARVLMALKILGAGKFHVWIKNVGDTPFAVAADQFSLLCRNGKRFGPYRSKDFELDLGPGQQVDGRISFETYCSPRELTYTNPVAGIVSRTVPETDP
ncbi:MAG: hypothetical protein JEZ11_18840 [Desulfobacterales bacterium]|nr:hypothetical protein [Desulfobacterales bacterium]